MYRRKLLSDLYRLMFAGGMVFVLATPAMAAPMNFNGAYWGPAQFQAGPQQYRYRPSNRMPFPPAQQRRFAPRYANPMTARVYSQQAPAYRGRLVRGAYVVPPRQYRRPMPRQAPFAYQYGWMPPMRPQRPHEFRHQGRMHNRYASHNSPVFDKRYSSVRQMAYNQARNFRFRPVSRSVNKRINFTDRQQPVAAMSQNNISSYGWRPQQQQHNGLHNPAQLRQAWLAKKQQSLAGNYRFRPDPRFKQVRQKAPVVKPRADFLPVSYKIADNQAQQTKPADNPWRKWTFRPVDTTF